MKKVLVILWIVGFTPSLWAQNDRLTPENLWKLGRVSLDAVSPDGQLVVYGVTRYDLRANRGDRDLYLIPAEGGQVKKITAFEGSEFNARWRPDGQKIGFLTSESGSNQLWEMNPDGTDKKQVSFIEGGINGFEYAPSGDRLLVLKSVKLDQTVNDLYPDLPQADARIIDDLMYRHWDSWHDYEYSHIFVADYRDSEILSEPRDIMAEEPFDAPLNPFGGMNEIAWSPDGQYLAYTCKKLSGQAYAESTNSDIYFYDLAKETTVNLTEGMLGYDKEPAFSPDGKYLAFNSMETPGFESDRNRIFIFDFGTQSMREITAGLDRDCNHPQWGAAGEQIYFITGEQATYQLGAVAVEDGKYRQITQGEHNYTSFDLAGDNLIGARMSMSAPTELYRVNAKKGEQTQLTTTNQALLSGMKMGQVKKRMVTTTDNRQMLTWVIYPPDFNPEQQYPTLLYCQGGPQSAVSQFFSYRWNFQLMAAQGYIVVAPNRRGLPTFGRDWNNAISGDWGGQAMQDLLSAIDEVADEPYVDRDNLGAVGASFGGYSVYWLAGNHNGRFSTFISHCGVFNLESWYGSTEEMFFANHDLEGAYWELKPNPSYKLHSPHLYVRNWDTPLLVIHGQKDYRVPVTEGLQAFQAAQLQDIPSRLLYFPEEGHWVRQPQNGVLWHRVFFDWLGRSLKQTEPVSSEQQPTEKSGGSPE
jgi:dipeptidyl aminopeptidase/acylaminoacyl peptidase